jgi:hypothetical protein
VGHQQMDVAGGGKSSVVSCLNVRGAQAWAAQKETSFHGFGMHGSLRNAPARWDCTKGLQSMQAKPSVTKTYSTACACTVPA